MANYSVHQAGDTALVVDFGNHVDLKISARVLALAKRLSALKLPGIVETVPTIRALSVYYEPLSISTNELQDRIEGLIENLQDTDVSGRTCEIPVCYNDDFGPDLNDVAQRCNLTPAQVIERHSSQTYHVYMLGFLPGLAYLGDLPDELALPRRKTPRPRIPALSLGIGGTMTCIYPMATPCGWHLIGRSPVPLWDHRLESGALLTAGDKVKFNPVSLREYERIRSDEPLAAVQMQSSH